MMSRPARQRSSLTQYRLPRASSALQQATFGRRTALAGGAVLAAGLFGSMVSAPAHADPTGAGSPRARRALASLAALHREFRDPASGYYRETIPHTGDNPWSYVWPYSQAMIAHQVVAGIPGLGRTAAAQVGELYRVLEDYWNPGTVPPGYDSYLRPPNGQGGDKFYDDNEWIGLGLVQRHLMSVHGDPGALRRAAQIFELIVHGWDDDPSHPCPGGVFWTQAPWSNDRNTVSNAPGAELGAQLYLITGRRSSLVWAQRMYDWVRTWMLAPNGLYWDHVNLAGEVERTQWSYNQGVMIGAGTLLHRATGNPARLAEAVGAADAALEHYAGDGWLTQPAEFNAIFFSNLLQLARVHPQARYLRALTDYADACEQFRQPNGLYQFRAGEPVTLLNQAGVVRVQAMAAWPQGRWGQLT